MWYFAKCGLKKGVRPSIHLRKRHDISSWFRRFWVYFRYFGNFTDILQKLPVITSWLQCFFWVKFQYFGNFSSRPRKRHNISSWFLRFFWQFYEFSQDCWICEFKTYRLSLLRSPPLPHPKKQSSKNKCIDSLGPARSNLILYSYFLNFLSWYLYFLILTTNKIHVSLKPKVIGLRKTKGTPFL